MITEYNYFSNALETVNQKLTDYTNDVKLLRKCRIADFSKESITNKYDAIFRSFPYIVESTSDEIKISINIIKIFDLYYEVSEHENELYSKKIEKAKAQLNDPKISNENRYEISEFLEEYLHNLTYEYESILKNTKEYHFFHGIDDETIILKNLLILYQSILKDKTKQLSVLEGVVMTKEISDLVTNILIDFIEQRLLVLNPQINTNTLTSKITFIENAQRRIEWLGSQQELCELFDTLVNKNWIPQIKTGERRAVAKAITNLFDLANTQKKKESDPDTSFYQQFKLELLDGERKLSFLDSPKYKRKFQDIITNF